MKNIDKEENDDKKKKRFLIILLIFLFIIICFIIFIYKNKKNYNLNKQTNEIINQTENNNNNININSDSKLDISIANVTIIDGSTSAIAPVLDKGNNIKFNIVLNNPGDFYGYIFTIKNNNLFDIEIGSITTSVLTQEQSKYLSFLLTYSDDKNISVGHKIKSGKEIKLKFISKYNSVDALPPNDVSANYNAKITFVQSK